MKSTMKSESELCVDKLLIQLGKIDNLVEKLISNKNDELICEARDLSTKTQSFVDNNKSIIPSYCLKKVIDSLKKLEKFIDEPQRAKLKFKFKSAPKTDIEPKEVSIKESEIISYNGDIELSTASFGFENRSNEKLALEQSDVEAKDISLIDLENCDVNIVGLANTVYIRNLKNTSVAVCLACRAITVINCANCQFELVCQQLRIDTTTQSTFKIYTSVRSMLESSNALEFHNLDLDGIERVGHKQVVDLFNKANFDVERNNWKCIDDFDWLSPDTKSKNFSIVEP